MRTGHLLVGFAVLIGAGLGLIGCDGTVVSSAGYKASTPTLETTTPSSGSATPSTPDAPFSSPGTDVTIAWTVAGADKAALAVDNPKTYAAYGTYASSDRLTLAFPSARNNP